MKPAAATGPRDRGHIMFAQSRYRYGARRVWLQLAREGIPVTPRCTVERLMRLGGPARRRQGREEAHHHPRGAGRAAR